MLKSTYLIFLITVISALQLFSQSKLTKDVIEQMNDSAYLCWQKGDYNQSIKYYHDALDIAKQLNETTLAAISLNNMGTIYLVQSDYGNALVFFERALVIFKSNKDLENNAKSLLNIGIVYKKMGNYETSIHFLLDAARIFENLQLDLEQASCYNSIANILRKQKHCQQSLKYHFLALQIRKDINYKKGIAGTYNNIALCYKDMDSLNLSMQYYKNALMIKQEIGNIQAISITLHNIGLLYMKQSRLDSAEMFYKKSLLLRQNTKDKRGICSEYNALGVLYIKTGDNKKAKENLLKSLKLAESIHSLELLLDNYQYLKKVYIMLGEYQKSIDCYDKYIALNDSVFGIEKTKALNQLMIQYETEKKENEITRLSQEQKLQRAENKNQNYLIILLGFIIVSAGVTAFLVRKAEKSKHNQKITEERAKEAESQKKRFAKELHDGTGSNLTGIRLQLLSLKEVINNHEVHEIINEVDKTHQGIRMLAYQASSPEFDRYTLDQAIEDLARRLSKTGQLQIQYMSTTNLNWSTVSNDFQLNIYRIIQEALSNVIKHADASHVDIQLLQHENNLNIVIEDNGKGFNKDIVDTGLGLSNIKERVNNLKGSLSIDSSLGYGCSIIIDVLV